VGGLGGLFLVASGIAALAIRRALLVAEEARAVAEGARRQSDLILTSAGEGICGIDSKGRVSFINPAARRMLGWSDDDPCGEGLHAATHHHHADGSDYPVEECPIRQVLVGSIGAGPVHVEDEVYWRRDGSCFPVEYTATAITGSDGKVVGAVNIFRDITERRRTEQEIRDLALRQRAILANTPIGIAIIALDRRMLEANDAFCAIYGRPGEDVIGQSARILYADQDQFDDVGRRAYPLLREGKTFSGDVHMVRRDGSEVWVRLVSHLIDETVPDLGVVWAAEDITERKLLELDLMRSNAELERFAYVASHDLRQPLRMISSYLRLIQRRLGPQLDGEIAEFLGFAVNGARRMDRMIIDLLDYARIGRDTAPPEEVPLATVLAGAIANLEVAIAESGALVTAPPELPVVPGYPSELERLFQNLIGNALKFRAPERAPKVELSCRETARDWVIAVADNGIGIAPEDHARLFMVFQRLVSVEQYEGTGIGLAACRKIVEHHGGRIWVESALGEGCTFLVSLPKRVEPAKEIGIP